MTKQIAVGASIAALLAGCSGTHSSAPTDSARRATQAMRQLSRCIRAHGLPGFPDPQVGNDGVPRLPDSAPAVPTATQRACRTVAARLPSQYTSTQPVSTRDFHELLAFARCVRTHGAPDWPDPNALGQFPLGARIRAGGKRLIAHAVDACSRLNPDPNGGIDAVRAP